MKQFNILKILRLVMGGALILIGLILLLGSAYGPGVAFIVLGLMLILVPEVIKATKGQKQKDERIAQLETDLSAANQRLSGLLKYEQIASVENECARLVSLANTEANSVKSAAYQEAEQIKAQAKIIRDSANNTRNKAMEESTARVNAAMEQARTIIDSAGKRAQEIAGSAYDAKMRAEEYQATVIALRNTIDGYGDAWLKPTYSLLDELAEDFGFAEAGKKLKEARIKTASMVASGAAAVCDYVEEKRRVTAIRFVTDAFNGKVDSILSKTKKDNYGKLEQQIRDAYSLVNYNGSAFRNARITPEYLDARLEELKWAVICNELKAQQQEEQRKIREQMREEEKARREYERAQREAAKEEAMLQKAMNKVRAEMAKAGEEQKAQYEAQLVDLQQKLVEAEAKNQRALSMAQQTKHGNVYVISNVGSFGENVYKVGMTRRLNPLDRVRELGDASVPFSFDVHAIIESDDAPALETALHKALALMQVNKVNPRKEFFRVNLADIKRLTENMNLSTTWTMEAEAAEYRETLAIENAMKNDPEAQRRWAAYYESIAEAEDELEEEPA